MTYADIEKLNGKQLLQLSLMCSYLYYKRNRPVIEDEVFDRVMYRLLELWDTFEHQHKHLLTKEDLKAGTAFAIKEYPEMIVQAAEKWLEDKARKDNANTYSTGD